MKTYCPYIDCSHLYEVESPDKSFFFNASCPKCDRLGRVKAIEIIDKLKIKEAKINQNFDSPDGQFQLLLEDIRSLWNVGSIFRTADAIGVSKLYLCGITGYPPRPEIRKTALGAEEDMPWHYLCQTMAAINKLKKAGITIIGLERNNESIDLVEFLKGKKLKMPICLAVGNEVNGLSPELILSCDYLCDLPMKGKKESLNVASALAVAAYFINEFV